MRRLEQIRKEQWHKTRREELDQWMRKIRAIEIQRLQEDQQFQQNGRYGQVLITDILTRSKYSSQVKELREKYTLETFFSFLGETYDNSVDNIQEAVIRIIESYFYQGFSQQPSQELIDQLLRLLVKSSNPTILKNILLISNSSLLDHYKFSNLLISKNFVPLILVVLENFINNQEITRLIFIVIGSMVQRADWSNDLTELIEPLLRAIKTTQTVEAQKFIQNIYHITRLNPEQIGPDVYKKGILTFCLDIIRRFRSRPASYLYFQFCSIFSSYLSLSDIGELMRAISDFRKAHFQIGEMSGKYSVSSIKNSAYGLVLYYLTLENEGIVAETQRFMEESGLRNELMQDLQQVSDHTLVKVLGNINLHFYRKSQAESRLQYKSAFETAIANWTDKDAGFQLQTDFETVTKYHLLQSGDEQMQIEL